MNRNLAEHGCGACGSPNCLAYALGGGGKCPFEASTGEWNRKAMDAILEMNFLGERGRPYEKTLSPCSEYTKYTLESVLHDPLDRTRSSLFEAESLGYLLELGDFRSLKWSSALGYGVCTVEEDTNAHVHSKGKIIIRHALTKEHALWIHAHLVSLTNPSVYSTRTGYTLADRIRRLSVYDDKGPDDELMDILRWQSEKPQDELHLEDIREGYKKADEEMGEATRSVISDLIRSWKGSANGEERNVPGWKHIFTGMDLSGIFIDIGEVPEISGEYLGGLSLYIGARKALTGISQFVRSMDQTQNRERVQGVIETSIELLEKGVCGEEVNDQIGELDEDILVIVKGLMKAVYHLAPMGIR